MFAVITRRPASADRTVRDANFRRELEATYRTLIDGYLESPFPTACLLYLKWSYLAKQCMGGSVLKTMELSAHAQNHVSPERCRKSFTVIFLGDHDIPLTGLNFGNLTAFIFSHIFTAHAQERPLMNFRLKF